MRGIDILKIKISDHFNFVKLIKFTFPSIVMMVFTSIYSVVDGFFVSNFTGKTQFAAVNLIMPFCCFSVLWALCSVQAETPLSQKLRARVKQKERIKFLPCLLLLLRLSDLFCLSPVNSLCRGLLKRLAQPRKCTIMQCCTEE